MPLSDKIKGTIRREGRTYVASCDDLFVVTQGETLAQAVENLQSAVRLYFRDERPEEHGFACAMV